MDDPVEDPFDSLVDSVAEAAQSGHFSGVIRIDEGRRTRFLEAYGMADRRWSVENRIDTRFAIASATKGFTALVVMSLVSDGVLSFSTTARSLLGDDLPLVDNGVTIEHLLSHRSGIGDYVDEDAPGAVDDYVMAIPVHQLDSSEAYLAVLGGHPTKFSPGEGFSYCNSGYALLAVLAERASHTPFAELIQSRVCEPAGLTQTTMLRSDELAPGVATGYLGDTDRTNVLHLPVVGTGDGGLYSTVDDIHRLWRAFFDGAIVTPEVVAKMLEPNGDFADGALRYGLGFWLSARGDGTLLIGYDAGVSFRSFHDRSGEVTWTVASNSSEGAWPITRLIGTSLMA